MTYADVPPRLKRIFAAFLVLAFLAFVFLLYKRSVARSAQVGDEPRTNDENDDEESAQRQQKALERRVVLFSWPPEQPLELQSAHHSKDRGDDHDLSSITQPTETSSRLSVKRSVAAAPPASDALPVDLEQNQCSEENDGDDQTPTTQIPPPQSETETTANKNNNENSLQPNLPINTVCSICLEAFRDHQDVVCRSKNPACLHTFHWTCMAEWLADHDECPICREQYLVSINNASASSAPTSTTDGTGDEE